MRLVKATLAGLLVIALGAMWTNRSWVVDAYGSDRPETTIRLSGVDLAVNPTALDPSPLDRPQAEVASFGRPTPLLGVGAPVSPEERPAATLAGGDAELTGTVTGPDGPVAGAVIRVERHSDDGVASMDAIAGDDGAWTVSPVAGGRYRVRAWLPGLLTTGRSEVRFVADDEVASFDFEVWGVDPTPVLELVDAGPLYDGIPGSVAVVVGWRSVDADGLVVTNPVVGTAVTVETTAQVEVLGPQPLITDGTGVVWVGLRCRPPGALVPTPTNQSPPIAPPVTGSQVDAGPGPSGALTARTGSIEATFALPGCQPIPPPDPEPDPEPDGDTATGADGSNPGDTTPDGADGGSDPADDAAPEPGDG